MVTLVMPAFWVGILFLTYFSVKLQLFPVAGIEADGDLAALFLVAIGLEHGSAHPMESGTG